MGKVRESNIEVLRIVLLIMVVILHSQNIYYSDFLGTKDVNLNTINFYLLRSFSICAVNTFIIISGYFLCSDNKVSYYKPFFLFITTIFFNLFLNLINVILKVDTFSLNLLLESLIPRNYYLWLYTALYLLHPFLNLFNRYLNRYLLLLLLLFSIFPTIVDFLPVPKTQLSFISYDGNLHGYTIVNFIITYYVGCYIRINEKKIILRKTVHFYFLSTIIIFAYSFIKPTFANDYCNIFIILQAACLFIIFIKANKWSNRIVNFISKSVWGGYLSNSFIINALKVFIFRDYNENYVSLYVIGLNIVLTFLIIIIVDNFFMLVLRPILTVIRKIIGTYQYSIEGFMEDENEKK